MSSFKDVCGINSVPVAGSDSEIASQLQGQDQDISIMKDTVQELRRRLYAVLKAQPEDNKKSVGDGACNPTVWSPFGQTVDNHNARIRACTADIYRLLDELAI